MNLELSADERKRLKIILYNFLGLSKNSNQIIDAKELFDKVCKLREDKE